MKIKSVTEAQSVLNSANKSTLVLFDVDDTLITPRSTSFRFQGNGILNPIDKLKVKKNHIQNFEELLGEWRLQRQVMLVEEHWPKVLERLKMQEAHVFGFTKMDTGKFGPILSMEDWRLSELRQYDLTFTKEVLGESFVRFWHEGSFYACFKEGIIFTSILNKRQALQYFLEHSPLQIDKIIFMDDRLEFVQEVESFVQSLSLKFHGFYYRGIESLEGKANPEIIELQTQKLLEQHQWLEDEEAHMLLKLGK